MNDPRLTYGAGQRRDGFTLVEMLVVIAVIGVIAGIGVFAIQPFQSRSSVSNGGVQLQSWLNAARSRAIRDRAPRGLRLLPGDEIQNDSGANITTLITKCVFIDQPDDTTGVGISTDPTQKGVLVPNPALNTIPKQGDYLEVNGGTSWEISNSTTTAITLKNVFPYTIPATSGASVPYRIIRAPQPPTAIVSNTTSGGQDVLRMPRGAAINVLANKTVNVGYNLSYTDNLPPPNGPNIDIIFSPNGNVLTGPNPDKIILWVTGTVRDAAGNISPTQGQPALVVVYPKSGLIAGYSANVGDLDKQKKTYYGQVP